MVSCPAPISFCLLLVELKLEKFIKNYSWGKYDKRILDATRNATQNNNDMKNTP